MFQFTCPRCNTGLKTGNGSGKVARCPNCLELIEVPKPLGQSALSAATDSISPPARTSDILNGQRKRVQNKTNLLVLGLAISGLACGGFMIVDFVAKSDSATKAARGLKPAGRIAAPLVRPFQPSFPPRVMAQAPVGKHRLRLGTSHFCHGGRVAALAASSEKKLLASCGEDGQVRIWDTKTGEAVRRFSGGGEPLRCVALSQDGRWVAASPGAGVFCRRSHTRLRQRRHNRPGLGPGRIAGRKKAALMIGLRISASRER
jgi:WD40 repeat protein